MAEIPLVMCCLEPPGDAAEGVLRTPARGVASRRGMEVRLAISVNLKLISGFWRGRFLTRALPVRPCAKAGIICRREADGAERNSGLGRGKPGVNQLSRWRRTITAWHGPCEDLVDQGRSAA